MQVETHVVIDLRNFNIRTKGDLRRVYCDALDDIHANMPDAQLEFICLTNEQLKWIRFQHFQLTQDAEAAKNYKPVDFEGLRIEYYDDVDGIPCPGCHKTH